MNRATEYVLYDCCAWMDQLSLFFPLHKSDATLRAQNVRAGLAVDPLQTQTVQLSIE
jgi:hypothetical protein